MIFHLKIWLTTRGNPFGNFGWQGDTVIVHSARSLEFQVSTLNSIRFEKKWHIPKNAISAMIMAKSHLEKLECYACHLTWEPGLTFHSVYKKDGQLLP
jgi:hypothetical protein